jgi:prepilin-type N-terminal cleavage/methylation domain-containing protein
MTTPRKAGFTLIELSIVLVIIGLLVGGILTGRDLILSATIRSQTSQFQEIETQINAFRLKYGCLPGDCANATDYFGTVAPSGVAITNGDGDGSIQGHGISAAKGECINSDVSDEVAKVFLLLKLAGLGNYNLSVTNPYAKFGNGTGTLVSCLDGGNPWPILTPAFLRQGNIIIVGIYASSYSRIGYSTGQYGVVSYSGYGNTSTMPLSPIGIPADVARRIDEKIDDGLPSTGKFGIIAGQTACDNAALSNAGSALLAAYPAPSVSCNATVGKRID